MSIRGNANIIEQTVYIGFEGSVTARLKEIDKTKIVDLELSDQAWTRVLSLNVQELSLLIEVLHDMKEKQSSARHYR